jgi:NAD(P)-dependent dehydrogenase (short-subunit alcohol dehydrogenase family)
MGLNLKGKVAVITGSGKEGIGTSIARDLAQEGVKVVVNDIAKTPEGVYLADKVAASIKNSGGTAVANYDSVTTMKGGENIINTAIQNFGKIDILVNCAGNFIYERSWDFTEAQWDSLMAVHCKGHFACIKAALPHMMQQKNGRIINFSSIAATFTHFSIGYSTAKAGIMGLTLSLAGDVQEFGITVNAIFPSAITALFPQEDRSQGLGDNMPVSPWLGPQYIAPLITYLASDDAQRITGQLLYSSGGDLCIYYRPLQLPGPHQFLRKNGKWTPQEIKDMFDNLIPQRSYIDTDKGLPPSK